MYKKTGWGFAIIALILGGSIYVCTTGKFILGIDLRGGTELAYELDLSRVSDESGVSPAEQVKSIVSNRLDSFGLKEISISIQGDNHMVVQLPGAGDSLEVENLKRQVELAGNLLFTLVAPAEEQNDARIKEIQEAEAKYLADDRAWFTRKRDFDENLRKETKAAQEFTEKRPEEPEFIARREVASTSEASTGKMTLKEKPNQWGKMLTVLHNAPDYKVSGSLLKDARSTYDENGRPAISFSFHQEGAIKFANLTGPNKGRLLAILLDDNIRSVATIKSRIYDQGQLTGSYSQAEVRGIVTILKGGSLPTKPRLVSETTVGAVLGQDSIQSGFIAVVAGIIGILVFMAVYYMVGGMIANFAMVFNVIIILTYVIVFRQTLTFPGIAGILLTLGMAVDANILIFERIREELGRGKSLLHAMGAGYQRAFWVIFDSNITTILTGVVLFQFGSGPVKGFAVTLIAGLIASFFTAVFVTRVLLSFLYNAGMLKNLHMLKIFSPPRIDVIGNRFRFISITVSIIVVTWIIFVIPRGSANYGIDFTGGTKITMNLSREIGMGDLRAKIDGLPASEKDLFKDYTIQTINARESGKASSFSILTRTEEKNIASAQERTDGMPPAPAAPVPAPAPATGAPQAEAATAVAGTATDSRAGTPSPEAMREGVLRRMLTKENLLLPNAFSEAKWEDVAQPSGAQRLVIDANVVRISTEFNMAGTSTTDGMKQALNGHFEKSPNVRFSGSKEATGFKGIRIQAVETVSAPAAAIAGEGSILVTSYRIITDPYTAPAPGAAEARDAPTHPEVVTAVKDWFRQNSKLLTVAEPIPEILSVGPKVAANLQAQAIIAIFFSLLGIMFYMALRFEFMYGVAGVVSLIHDVLITIGIIAVTDALLGDTFSLKINLAEMAAILTIIGFSINDTIVVFDRVRELQKTIKRKLEFTEVINAAVNQTLSRTIWTSLTTLIVTLALLLFGGEPVRGFAFAFAVGIVTGTYSSIFIASPVVVWMHNRQVIHREMLQQEAQKA